MNTEPSELQLMQLYRDWWQDSYGVQPNNQAAVIAAAWARHVLNVLAEPGNEEAEIADYYTKLQAQQDSGMCVYHPKQEQADE